MPNVSFTREELAIMGQLCDMWSDSLQSASEEFVKEQKQYTSKVSRINEKTANALRK